MEQMILINGATGNIGHRAAETLLAKGVKVRVTGRNEEKLNALAQKGAEVMKGELTDVEFLKKAFNGVKAAFTILPPHMQAEDMAAYQMGITKNYAEAIKASGVKYIVNLSSVGAHTTVGNGAIGGLARQEQVFNEIEGLNVIHVRAAYFLENAFWGLDLIKHMGINGSPSAPDLKIPMIATQDIAHFVAENLQQLSFSGKKVQALLGASDYTMQEFTSILGKAIGKNELAYVQFPADQALKSMMEMGMSASVAQSMLEIQQSVGTPEMSREKRDTSSTTKTSAEEFAHTFAYVFNLQ